jgi:hypothetical protein
MNRRGHRYDGSENRDNIRFVDCHSSYQDLVSAGLVSRTGSEFRELRSFSWQGWCAAFEVCGRGAGDRAVLFGIWRAEQVLRARRQLGLGWTSRIFFWVWRFRTGSGGSFLHVFFGRFSGPDRKKHLGTNGLLNFGNPTDPFALISFVAYIASNRFEGEVAC